MTCIHSTELSLTQNLSVAGAEWKESWGKVCLLPTTYERSDYENTGDPEYNDTCDLK